MTHDVSIGRETVPIPSPPLPSRLSLPPSQRTPWDAARVLRSNDGDPELLLHIPFDGAVKLKALCVVGGDDDKAPGKMRLFTNREDLDFAAVAEMPPVQEFQMTHDPRGEVEYTTQVAKFQGVYHLTIHIPEGLGAEQTEIGFVGLKGEHVQRKREAVEAVYEIRPVPKDTDHVRNTMGAAWESGHS